MKQYIPCIVFTKVDSGLKPLSNPKAEEVVKSDRFGGFINLKDSYGRWSTYVIEITERVK